MSTTTDAQAAANEAIERARQNANPDWLVFAEHCARYVAQFKAGADGTFTMDDVWAEMAHRREIAGRVRLPETHETRAMGAVMVKLRRAGVVEATGEWRKSTSRVNHGRPQTVWRMARKEAAA